MSGIIGAMPTFDDALRSLDEAFRASRVERHVPGMAWGVVRDGALVHAAGDGTLRDGETRLPDERSVFRIASMTKSFTAATILQLRDEGRLRLDDPVAAARRRRWTGGPRPPRTPGRSRSASC